MRKTPFITEEIYHIYNRGVDKRDIFSTTSDLDRFRMSIKYFNNKKPIGSLYLNGFKKDENNEVEYLVEIISYNILPNHFHFILKQKIEGGISEFMKRLLGGYTNYFNEKQKRSGALFQGRFKSIHVSTDDYLNILLGYVNYNNFIHNIPDHKKQFISSSVKEIESGVYFLLEKSSVTEHVLKRFKNVKMFKRHCKEIAEIIKAQRMEDLIPSGYLFDIL